MINIKEWREKLAKTPQGPRRVQRTEGIQVAVPNPDPFKNPIINWLSEEDLNFLVELRDALPEFLNEIENLQKTVDRHVDASWAESDARQFGYKIR